jgi:hypothetical protein
MDVWFTAILLKLVKHVESAVTCSEHRRHSARTGEGPADPLTYLHSAIGIRIMTARYCEWRR